MNPLKLVGVVLVVAGTFALAYGGFSYTKETHKTEIGKFKFSMQEEEHVNVPMWAGVAAIVAGVVLLVIPKK